VAQRRRRVFVVGCFGDWRHPAKVLFESESVRRNTPPSREAREETAKCLTAGVGKRYDPETETLPVAFDWQSGGDARGLDPKDTAMLQRNQVPAVAQPITQFGDLAGCLTAQDGSPYADRGQNVVAQPINIYGGNKRADRPEGGFYVRTNEPTSKTLDAASGLNPTCCQGGTAVMQLIAQPYVGGVDYENNAHTMDEPTGPLLKGSPTGGGRPLPAIATAMQVRRLTPVECERLQGFPDGYTNIPWRKKPESPDGPRYKALGNSMAVPVMRWIGERINKVDSE
jgi:DNA (cytosine-5)-methyltransferase 1